MADLNPSEILHFGEASQLKNIQPTEDSSISSSRAITSSEHRLDHEPDHKQDQEQDHEPDQEVDHEQDHEPDQEPDHELELTQAQSAEHFANRLSNHPQEAHQSTCQSTHNDSTSKHLSDHTHDKTSSSLSEQTQERSTRPNWPFNKGLKNNSRCLPIDHQSIIGSSYHYSKRTSGGSADKDVSSGFGRQDIAQIEHELARDMSSAAGLFSDALKASVVIPLIASAMTASSYLMMRAKALLDEIGSNALKEKLLDVFAEASPTDEKEGGVLVSKISQTTISIRSGSSKLPLNSGTQESVSTKSLHELPERSFSRTMTVKQRPAYAHLVGNSNQKGDGISMGKFSGDQTSRDSLESVPTAELLSTAQIVDILLAAELQKKLAGYVSDSLESVPTAELLSTAQIVDILLAAEVQKKLADSYSDQPTLNLLQYAPAQTNTSIKSTKKTTKKTVSSNHETRSRRNLSQQAGQQLISTIRKLLQFNNAERKGSHTSITSSITNNNSLAEGKREPTVPAIEHCSSELPSRVVIHRDSVPSPDGTVVSEDRQDSGSVPDAEQFNAIGNGEQTTDLLEDTSPRTGLSDSDLVPEPLYSLSASGSGLISFSSPWSLVAENGNGSNHSSLLTSLSTNVQLYCQEDSDSLGLVPVQPISIKEWLKRRRFAGPSDESDSKDSNPHVAGDYNPKDPTIAQTKRILGNRDGLSTGLNSATPPIIFSIIPIKVYPPSIQFDLTTSEGRFASFVEADIPLPAADLVAAGFSSSSILDRRRSAVFCSRCRIELDRLNDKLDAMALHKTLGEDCPFMLEFSESEMHLEEDTDTGVNREIVVNNLVVQQSPGASAMPTPSEIYKHHNTLQLALAKSHDAGGESNEDLVKLAAQITRPLEAPNNDFRELGVMSDRPKHPKMALESNRKESMKTYHNTHLVDPKAAVTAGFFWSGQGDLMICFSCGIEHSDWTADTAPLKRHMVISPKCIFLLSMYNQEYVDQTIANEPTYTPPPRQVEIESVPVRAVKPRNEVPLAANIKGNVTLFSNDDPPPERVVEKTWEVIEERIKYGEPDYTRECELVNELLEKERALNETTTIPPENPLQFVNRSSMDETDGIQIQSKYQAQITDEEPEPRKSGHDSTTCRQNEPEPLDLEPAKLVSIARCLICLDEPKEIMFVPCTHLAACTKCGLTQPQCPVCSRDVKGTVRVSI